MNKDQIKKVEEEALMQYDYSTELVDSSHTNFEHTNKIHTIRCQRAFINGAQFGYKMAGEWVKVEDRLPEDPNEVVIVSFVYNNGYHVNRYPHYYENGVWHTLDDYKPTIYIISHWQPLPTPPTFSDEG